jgi:hypothetical protein
MDSQRMEFFGDPQARGSYASVKDPKFDEVIAKAWRDPAFKLALIANSAIAV